MKPYITALAVVLAAVLAAAALNRPARASAATCDPALPPAQYVDCVDALRAAAIAQLGITNAPTPEPYSYWETQDDGAQVRLEFQTFREPTVVDGVRTTRPSRGVPVEVERRDRSGQRRTYAKPTRVPQPVETPRIVSSDYSAGYFVTGHITSFHVHPADRVKRGLRDSAEYLRQNDLFRCFMYASDGKVVCLSPSMALLPPRRLETQATEDQRFPGPGAEWFGTDHPCNTDNYRDEPRCLRAPGNVYSPGHIPEPYYIDYTWIHTCDAVAEDGSCQTWSQRRYENYRPPTDEAWRAAYACVDRRERLPSGLVREWRDCRTPLGNSTVKE